MRKLKEVASPNNADTLNPVLFDDSRKLKPEVKESIIRIVNEFLEYISVDIKILDIRLVGSNAAYNYGEHSDLDIHIVTNLSEISDPEIIARLYFDSIKKNFKDSYDIKIKGIEVELYVEDVNASSVSNGVYSVTNDTWVKEPTPLEDPTDEDLVSADEIERGIIQSIKSCHSVEELEGIIDSLYILRKDSLSSDGENGVGNLVFKSLRNKGILDKVKQLLRDITSTELSLESKKI